MNGIIDPGIGSRLAMAGVPIMIGMDRAVLAVLSGTRNEAGKATGEMPVKVTVRSREDPIFAGMAHHGLIRHLCRGIPMTLRGSFPANSS